MNDWFTQQDVLEWAAQMPQAEFIPIYRKVYSLVERETLRLLGIRAADLSHALDDTEYNTQIRQADLFFHKKRRGMVYCSDRISKRLFPRPGVKPQHGGWFDTTDDRYLTTDMYRETHGRTEIEIAIRRDILQADLARHHRKPIITISSFRYTERTLAEMSLIPSQAIRRGNNFALVHLVRDHAIGGNFRMQSSSLVEGKVRID